MKVDRQNKEEIKYLIKQAILNPDYELECILGRDYTGNSNISNKQFEKVHSEENKDNPWSIHYEKNKVNKHYNLDILRPDEYRRKYYYEFGIDYCDDFTQPGKFTDISHLSDDLSNVNLESTDLDTLLKSRETIEYSEEINLQEIQKQQVMSQLQNDRHQVQLERDLKILKLATS